MEKVPENTQIYKVGNNLDKILQKPLTPDVQLEQFIFNADH